MSSSTDLLAASAPSLVARCKSLINNDLKKICKEEGRIQSGNKAQLQTRVIDLINSAVQEGDHWALDRLKYRINNHGDAPPDYHSDAPSGYAHTDPSADGLSSPTASYNNNSMSTYGGGKTYSPYQAPPPPVATGPPRVFKPSPFFELKEVLLENFSLDTSPSHRNTVTRTLTIPHDVGMRMKEDSSLRLVLYSALDQALSNSAALHDVAFPQQMEVKINSDVVNANFKGLKNKPGSTRPADITDFVRKNPPRYPNSLQIQYALTQKASNALKEAFFSTLSVFEDCTLTSSQKYNVYVYLAKKHPIEHLARRIKEHNVITKQSVLAEMRRKAQDPDIEVGAITMSLKDPVSTIRINIPCRSTVCSHIQCFDAESFLQLQEQAPTWTCPICNKIVSFEALAVDQYVQEILKSVPKGTDQVTIEPNGIWSCGNASESQNSRTNGYSANHNDSDDDLIDITDNRISAIKNEAIPTPQSLTRTPPLSSREASSAPRTGNKRKAEVIDLTFSDDDEPARPAKKVAYNHTPTSLSDPFRPRFTPPGGSTALHTYPPIQPPNSRATDYIPHNHQFPAEQPSYESYRQPQARQSHSGQGTSEYPAFLDSSP